MHAHRRLRPQRILLPHQLVDLGRGIDASPGEFTDSPFVQEMTGVGNVCERAAMRGAEKLLVKKTAVDGVTVAVAAEHWEVTFG